MMMRWKLANKLNKQRLSSGNHPDHEEVVQGVTRKVSLPASAKMMVMQPKRVSLCSDSEKEDSCSVMTSSTCSITDSPAPTLEAPKKPTKLALPSDICFAPIRVSRRIDFESPKALILHGKDHSFSTPQAALVSPRLTPDSTAGPSFEDSRKQEIVAMPMGRIRFPPALYIPTIDEQGAASILISLKEEGEGIEEELRGPLLFTPPKRRRTTQENTKQVLQSMGAHSGTLDESNDEKLPVKKRRMYVRSNKKSFATRATRASIAASQAPKTKIPESTGLTGIRLAMPNDPQELNRLHCFVRSDLLEVFAMDEHNSKDKGSAPKVGLRCVYCGHLPRKEKEGASMSIFYPKSMQDIYRGVCTWQRIHFKACKHIPQELVERYDYLKEMDRTRGKKHHWVNSAYRLGLRNYDDNRGGIVWDPEEQPVTK